MKTELKEFIAKYLAIVGGTFLAVSFVAFVSIPYTLGNASGGLSMDQLSNMVTTTVSGQAPL